MINDGSSDQTSDPQPDTPSRKSPSLPETSEVSSPPSARLDSARRLSVGSRSGSTSSRRPSIGSRHSHARVLSSEDVLAGWLKKKHNRQTNMLNMNKEAIHCGWAKRFFNVDESQGTIGYAKAEKKKQSVVLPLADITAVTEGAVLEFPSPGHNVIIYSFLIKCPPVELTVGADSEEMREAWVSGLRERIATWRGRMMQISQSVGYHVALDSPASSKASTPSSAGRDPRGAKTARFDLNSEKVQKQLAEADHNWIKQEMRRDGVGSSPLSRPRPAEAQHLPQPSQLSSQPVMVKPARQSSPPPREKGPVLTRIAMDDQTDAAKRDGRACDDVHPVTDEADGYSPVEPITSSRVDEMASRPRPRKAFAPEPNEQRHDAFAPRKDLAEMLSSDEEEDD